MSTIAVENKKKRKKSSFILDARTKIGLLILMSIIVFSTKTTEMLFIPIIFTSILMLASGIYKTTLKFISVCIVFNSVDSIFMLIGINDDFAIIILIAIGIIQKFMILTVMGSYVQRTTSVSELINSLARIKIPREITVPLAVTLRFAPSIRQEFSYIKDTMKIRNIEISFIGLIRHPIKTIEHSLVPLLMRSFKISDELSASGMTRGLDNPKKKTALIEPKLTSLDVVMLILGTIITSGSMILDNIFII